jgi:hypothetical protein
MRLTRRHSRGPLVAHNGGDLRFDHPSIMDTLSIEFLDRVAIPMLLLFTGSCSGVWRSVLAVG